jgi:hypothetical protein
MRERRCVSFESYRFDLWAHFCPLSLEFASVRLVATAEARVAKTRMRARFERKTAGVTVRFRTHMSTRRRVCPTGLAFVLLFFARDA